MSAKNNILYAAASLAASEGITALGVERIVQAAGVSKGSFFYHFATKEEMIRALFKHVAERCISEVDEAVANGARFTDAFIEMVVRDLREKGELIAVIVATVALDPSLRAVLTAHSEDLHKRMIKEDALSEEQADLLRLVIDGAMIGTVLYEPEGKLERIESAKRVLYWILRETVG